MAKPESINNTCSPATETTAGTRTVAELIKNPELATTAEELQIITAVRKYVDIVREKHKLKRETEFLQLYCEIQKKINNIYELIPATVENLNALARWGVTSENTESVTAVGFGELWRAVDELISTVPEQLRNIKPVPGHAEDLKKLIHNYNELVLMLRKFAQEPTKDNDR